MSKRKGKLNSVKRSASKRRQHPSRGGGSWLWLAGGVAIVAGIVTINLLQPDVTVGRVEPSRSETVAELLPLSESGSRLTGGHEMALIPQQTPAPRALAADELAPQVHLPTAAFDWGTIPSSQDVSYVFAVENTGAADLVIDNLVTSCGCTTAELTSAIVPPGERADLTVTFDANFHPTEGWVTRLVWFATNDPTQPWVEVRLTANVIP